MYTIHFEKDSFPVEALLEQRVRGLAQHLIGRHPGVLTLDIHVGRSFPRRGGAAYHVRITITSRGASRTVNGQSLPHVRAALRSAFDAANAHLNHRIRHRRRCGVSIRETLSAAA